MASSTQDLEQFVRTALEKGAKRDQIDKALADAGWAPEQTRSALSAYADVNFVVPVPQPRPYLSARDAFLYLVLFTTLYMSAFHLGSLLFELINRAFPDPAQFRSGGLSTSIRWSVASLLVAFPVFLSMSIKIGHDVARQPVLRQSVVRRWLTYLTLFVAAVSLIIDLIILVDGVLGGEATARFMLKVLVAGVIAVVVFGYYLWDLRQDERTP
jgi:hypothetical protein